MEALLKEWTGWLARGTEGAAALIIGFAVLQAAWGALRLFARNGTQDAKENVRLHLARWLAVALEFGLAADILRTAITPTWNEIGQLAAIAVLRTALNYFLQQEIDRAAVRHSDPSAQTSGQAKPTYPGGDVVPATAGSMAEHTVQDGRNHVNP